MSIKWFLKIWDFSENIELIKKNFENITRIHPDTSRIIKNTNIEYLNIIKKEKKDIHKTRREWFYVV